MQQNGWMLLKDSFIDCPPWPDIGMNKELFIAKLIGKQPSPKATSPKESISIMPYYEGKDPGFQERMLHFSWLERIAPNFFKQYWAHHRYLAFIRP